MSAGTPINFQSIIDAVLPPAQLRAMKKHGPKLSAAILAGLQQAQLPNLPLDAGQCKDQPPTHSGVGLGIRAGQTATSLLTTPAAGTTQTLLGASTSIPIIGTIISIGLGIFSAVFGRHAQRVATEQLTLCNAIPSANAVLRDLDARVAAGHVDLDQAFAELDGLAQGFRDALRPILNQNETGSVCNAACGYIKMLDAQVLLRKRIYTDPDPQSAGNLLERFLQLAATSGAAYAAAVLL